MRLLREQPFDRVPIVARATELISEGASVYVWGFRTLLGLCPGP
jgi:hypothetical protein